MSFDFGTNVCTLFQHLGGTFLGLLCLQLEFLGLEFDPLVFGEENVSAFSLIALLVRVHVGQALEVSIWVVDGHEGQDVGLIFLL